MFHDIPSVVEDRMKYLEGIDARDRGDGTPRMQRLRQIPPETGRFISILAACAPKGEMIEIGTSAGYSTLWLTLACQQTGRTITTFEVLDDKWNAAKETFRLAGVQNTVNLVLGDALEHLDNFDNISFCFLDAEKEAYLPCYKALIPKMVSGGILVADNAINHREALQSLLDCALSDNRVDALVVPIGKGELVCRRL